MNSLERKLAIVTGGTSGIGYGIAESLGAKFDLALIYFQNFERAEAAKEKLKEIHQESNIRVFCCDIRDNSAVGQVYKEIKHQMGHPYLLINSAGQASAELFILEDIAIYGRLMELNYIGPVNVIKTVVTDMIRKRAGRIINISSMSAGAYLEGHSAYGASKAAMEHFTHVVAGELIRYNVTVNIIRPSLVITPLSEKFYRKISSDTKKLEAIIGPLKKPIEISEICRAIHFLIESEQVTSSVIDIDYGQGRIVRI